MASKPKVRTDKGEFTPNDKCHLGTGGEASVYEFKGQAVKLYTDAAKMIPHAKVKELMAIADPGVVRPQGFAFDAGTGDLIGYTMPLIDPDHCEPICKLFTPGFKKDNGLGTGALLDVATELHEVMQAIHTARCLAVDFNELNILVEHLKKPKVIDTDSFQTPSFPATAIMESIRDYLVKNNKWTPESDWFSWAVIVFQMMMGIHPFKGSHPDFKMKDWRERMAKSVSVYDKKAGLPPIVPPFSILPSRLNGWFENVFQKGERSVPPLPNSQAPAAVPPQVVVARSTDKFKVTEVRTFGDEILDVVPFMGIWHVLTKKEIWRGQRHVDTTVLSSDKSAVTRVIPFETSDTVQATWNGAIQRGLVTFRQNANAYDSAAGHGLFVRHGCAYTLGQSEQFQEVSFSRLGQRLYASTRPLDGIIGRSAKLFDGVVLQSLVGRTAAIVPFEKGKTLNRILPELDGYRIVDAQAHWPVLVVIGEKKGKFDRLVFGFPHAKQPPKVRVDADISYNGINMTITPRGACVMLLSDSELAMCKPTDPTQMSIVANPPFDTSMKLFSDPIGTFFISANSIFHLEIA